MYLHNVAVTNIFCQTKKNFAFSKIGFCASTNTVKFFGWLQKFGPAQNILGSVKGQGLEKRFTDLGLNTLFNSSSRNHKLL